MTARTRIFRYVRFRDIGAYLDLGWHFDETSLHLPHANHGVILEWLCSCWPIEPTGPRE